MISQRYHYSRWRKRESSSISVVEAVFQDHGSCQIASSDVENALYAHQSVAEAAAVGIPDAVLGELVGSIVSLHPRATGGIVDEAVLLSVARPL